MSPDLPNPSSGDHLEIAFAHFLFADALRAGTRWEDATTVGWAITAVFYGVLHVTRAYLSAKKGYQVSSHENMGQVWRRYPELKRIRLDYLWLKELSESARYYGNPHFRWDDFEKVRRLGLSLARTWALKAR